MPDTARVSAPLLAVDDLEFSYGHVQVLFGVTIAVVPGEVLALVGPNGAGKTTFLRCVAGLLEPARGSIHFDGADISKTPAEQRAGFGLVTVFGGGAVFGDMTVHDNLRAGADLLTGGALVEARIAETYEIFPRLAERRRSLAVQLSGGEQQMLALGKAFLLRPRLLCIDELSMGLAPVLVGRLLDVLRGFRDAGVTILLVEQSAAVAASIADRAAVMERGDVKVIGPADEVLDPDVLHSVLMAPAVPPAEPATAEVPATAEPATVAAAT